MQVMSVLVLKSLNSFIREKEVTEAIRNLTQFKERRTKQ